jgi:hypothetical protein
MDIEAYLQAHGPMRSSKIAEVLQSVHGLTDMAARQRLSRVKKPIYQFGVSLFPKNESFIHLSTDRASERFWNNLLRDLRETGSIYGAALDALISRGGVVDERQWQVISGGTSAIGKKHPSALSMKTKMLAAELIDESQHWQQEKLIRLSRKFQAWTKVQEIPEFYARRRVELLILDQVREWARRIGLASFDKITTRDSDGWGPVGSFAFDLAGPCYLLPVRKGKNQPAFLIADLALGDRQTPEQIQYFLKKTASLNKTLKTGALPLLVADEFTGEAMTVGHRAGVMMASLDSIFGRHASEGFRELMMVMGKMAAYAAGNPEKIIQIMDRLAGLDSGSGNMRGLLFEFITGHLVRKRRAGEFIEMGLQVPREHTSEAAEGTEYQMAGDIDVLAVDIEHGAASCIECKGKLPGGVLSAQEVEKWIGKMSSFTTFVKQKHSGVANVHFELWTTGTFHADALARLEGVRSHRTKSTISWMDGEDIVKLSLQLKLKSITGALRQYFVPMKPIIVYPNGLVSSSEEGTASLPKLP